MKLILPAQDTNTQTHNYIKEQMLRGKSLCLRFSSDHLSRPLVTIEISGIQSFTYLLNEASTIWILNYCLTGETEDFGINPSELMNKNPCFELELFKHLIELGHTFDYPPRFRERPNWTEVMKVCKYGIIFFTFKRTPELIEYLQSYKQPVD